MPLPSRDPAPLVQTSPAAVALLATALVALVVVGYFVVRDLGASVDEAASKVGTVVDAAKETLTSEAPASAPAVETAAPQAARPGTRLGQLIFAVEQCVPTLAQFAEGVRLIGVDASPEGVDFVQESAGTKGRFIRMSCSLAGGLAESGRMTLPPRVGDPAKMPAKLIDHAELTNELFRKLADAAGARDPDAVGRIEIAWVEGSGVLARVTLGAGPEARRVVVDASGRRLQGVFFPRVERFRDVSSEAAAQAALDGYRDQGEYVWSGGVGGTIADMQAKFEPSQKFIAIEFVGTRATFVIPSGAGAQQIEVDEYGDRGDAKPAERFPHYCARAFGFRDARTALDEAIRARRETSAQFEEHTFQFAMLDCLDDPKKPRWRFQ